MKKKHLYVIPTNRLCEKTIESMISEKIKYENEEIVFAIVDSSKETYSKKNYDMIRGITQNYSLKDVYYFNVDEFDQEMSKQLHSVWRNGCSEELLVGNKFSYGMAANRTYLIAIILGAEYIHRRDSDVYLQKYNKGNLLPYEIECQYLGKKIKDVCKNTEGISQYNDNDVIYMVGSGYIGDWAIDYSELKDNKEALLKVFGLSKPTLSDDQLWKYIQTKYVLGSQETYNGDCLSYDNRINIDVGNSSIYKLFYKLPFSPAEYTSGTDYFYHGILDAVEAPYLYHNRKVIHKYDDARYAVLDRRRYHYTKALSRCNGVIYRTLYENIKLNSIKIEDKDIGRSISTLLEELACKDWQRNMDCFLDQMISVYNDIDNDSFHEASDFIKENHLQIINKVIKDAGSHSKLIKIWDKVVDKLLDRTEILERFRVGY